MYFQREKYVYTCMASNSKYYKQVSLSWSIFKEARGLFKEVMVWWINCHNWLALHGYCIVRCVTYTAVVPQRPSYGPETHCVL